MALRVDMMGKKCRECGKGHYRENSLYDDWEGYVTCSECLDRVERRPHKDHATPTKGMNEVKFRETLENWVEPLARQFAAEKMGLVKDKHGERLPYELWSQALPHARKFLNLE